MKNIIKIVILGIVGFGILVYLTAPKNINKIDENQNVTIESLPRYFDVLEKIHIQKCRIYLKKVKRSI